MTPSSNVQTKGWTRKDFAATFQRLVRERYEEVGREIKRLRVAQGHSQESLAAAAGLSSKTISRIESPPRNGPFETRGSTFRKLASALGVSVAHLRAPLNEAATITVAPAGRADLSTAAQESRRMRQEERDAADQDEGREQHG